jgi:hypothetical protein
MTAKPTNYKMGKPRERQSQKELLIETQNTEVFVEWRFSLQGL